MKKLALILFLISSIAASSQEWEAWTPSGNPVNHFDRDNYFYVSGSTLHMFELNTDSVDFGLPITGVYRVPYYGDFYVTAGNGTYSDGLYFYNKLNGETNVVDYLIRPQFLSKFDTTFYIGCLGGLYTSFNLNDWELHTSFSNDELVTHYFQDGTNRTICVRKETSPNQYSHYIKHSEDNGENWQTDTLPGLIVDCDYDENSGILALILADENNETALYESTDNCETLTFTREFPNANLVKVFNEYVFGIGQSRDTNVACYGVSLYWKQNNHQSFINGNLPTHNILFIGETEMDCFNITIGTDMGAFALCGLPSYLREIENTSFSISPNPVNNTLTLSLNQKEAKPVSVSITDMNGRLLYRETKHYIDNQIQIKTNSIPKGFYIISITTDDQWIGTEKFIKE